MVRAYPQDPRRTRLDERGLLVSIPRPNLNDVTHGMPEPDDDLGAYIHECRVRMRKALLRFATMEARINTLEDWYIASMEGRVFEGGIQLGKDAAIMLLVAKRDNARQRVRTYAEAIKAELALLDIKP